MPGDADPSSAEPRLNPEIHVFRLDMQCSYIQAVDPFLNGDSVLIDPFPFLNRVFFVKVTGPYDLVGILTLAQLCAPGQRKGGEQAEAPTKGALGFSFLQDIPESLAGSHGLCDLLGLHNRKVGERVWSVEIEAPVQVPVKCFLTRRVKNQLVVICLQIELAFHNRGHSQAENGVHAPVQELALKHFRHFQGSQIVSDQHDIPFPEWSFSCCFQRP